MIMVYVFLVMVTGFAFFILTTKKITVFFLIINTKTTRTIHNLQHFTPALLSILFGNKYFLGKDLQFSMEFFVETENLNDFVST